MPSPDRTVSALVYALLYEHAPDAVPLLGNDVVRFVLAQRERMPDYLGRAMRLATLGLDLWTRLTRLSAFHHLDVEQRCRVIAAWRASRISVRRDLIRFYESLAVYGCRAIQEERGDGE